MDLRDAIALPATCAFIAGGFCCIVAQRLRFHRRRAQERQGTPRPSAWQRLTPREKLVRRIMGIAFGIAVAVLLQVVAREVLDALSL
jgi:hypothetical protein